MKRRTDFRTPEFDSVDLLVFRLFAQAGGPELMEDTVLFVEARWREHGAGVLADLRAHGLDVSRLIDHLGDPE